MTEKDTEASLIKLSHWLEQDDISVISDGYRDDLPETETETERETEKEAKTELSVEPQSVSLPVVEVPILGNKTYGVSPEMVAEWSKAYPAVDVVSELHKMRVWSLSNPTKQKTSSGIARFVNAWLSKTQNEAGKLPSGGFKNQGDRNADVISGLTRGLVGGGSNVKLLGI